jgi:itaconyl-CoA hydratase
MLVHRQQREPDIVRIGDGAAGPVLVGDTLYAESEVLAKRVSKSRPDQGLVTVKTRGVKSDGTVFMEFERTVLLPRQAA